MRDIGNQSIAEYSKDRPYTASWPLTLPPETIDQPPGPYPELQEGNVQEPIPVKRYEPTLSEMLSSPEETFSLLQMIEQQFANPVGFTIKLVPIEPQMQRPGMMSPEKLSPLTANELVNSVSRTGESAISSPAVDVADRAQTKPLLSRNFSNDPRMHYYEPTGPQKGLAQGSVVRSGFSDKYGPIPVLTRRF